MQIFDEKISSCCITILTELENELDEKIDALQDKEGERIKAGELRWLFIRILANFPGRSSHENEYHTFVITILFQCSRCWNMRMKSAS